MNIKSVEDVFIHLLSDTYSAEKQLTRALSKLARAASSEKLRMTLISTSSPREAALSRLRSMVIVSMMSAATRTSRPSSRGRAKPARAAS